MADLETSHATIDHTGLTGVGGGSGGVSVHRVFPNSGTDITTSSTSYADATGYTSTFAAADGDTLLCAAQLTVYPNVGSGAGYKAEFVFNVGGNDIKPSYVTTSLGDLEEETVTLFTSYVVQAGDLSGGDVTVKIRWKSSAANQRRINETDAARRGVMTITQIT